MRNLIQSVPAAEAAYMADDDQGVVDAINDPTVQVLKTGDDRRPGFASNATMGRDLGQDGIGAFLMAMNGVIDLYSSPGQQQDVPKAGVIKSFLARFETTPDGLDFTNDLIRDTIGPILDAAGIPSDPYLELGYSTISAATQELNRDATLDDVAQARAADASEAFEVEFDAAWNQHVSGPKNAGDRNATVAGLRSLADELEA